MHRKNPSVAELKNPLMYEVIDVVDHSDIHRWVGGHLFRAGWITGLYWAFNLATLAVVVLFWRRAGLPWLDAFSAVSLGMLVGWLTMLPVHELVHAAAYRLVGATNVLIRYELRRATAYCLAPNQVFDAPAFAWVALSPLMVLQPLLTLLPFLVDSAQFALFLAGAAMLHIGATSGDVAFVHYLWGYRTHPLYTYDDVDASKTYFVRATSGE